MDAATAAVLSSQSLSTPGVVAGVAGRGRSYLEWDARKREVLSEFTLAGKLSVAASFLLDESEEGDVEDLSVPLAKARARLEALEAAARGGGSVELSQAEYERRISKLSRDLTRAWNGSQRVTSLKIAIQCAKLLAEARVPAFYPSMFVLVTDVLDTFGRCVFSRLRSAAVEEQARMGSSRDGALPDDFASGDVGAEVREMCRNWVYKTACIRELLPRLYVEISLLECYRFLHANADFAPIILRLSHSIRGIGNPLVAVYARWYLARQAARLIHDPERLRAALLSTVTDYMYTFGEIAAGTRAREGLQTHEYLRLHSPAIAWILAIVGAGASKDIFQKVLAAYRDCCGNSMVLRHVIDGFDAAHWSQHLASMLTLAKVRQIDADTFASPFISLTAPPAPSPPLPLVPPRSGVNRRRCADWEHPSHDRPSRHYSARRRGMHCRPVSISVSSACVVPATRSPAYQLPQRRVESN